VVGWRVREGEIEKGNKEEEEDKRIGEDKDREEERVSVCGRKTRSPSTFGFLIVRTELVVFWWVGLDVVEGEGFLAFCARTRCLGRAGRVKCPILDTIEELDEDDGSDIERVDGDKIGNGLTQGSVFVVVVEEEEEVDEVGIGGGNIVSVKLILFVVLGSIKGRTGRIGEFVNWLLFVFEEINIAFCGLILKWKEEGIKFEREGVGVLVNGGGEREDEDEDEDEDKEDVVEIE